MTPGSLDEAGRLLDEALVLYGADLEPRQRLEALRQQAAEPLRVVLVGTVTGSLPESWRRWSFPTLAAIGGVTIESKFSNGVLVIATTAIAAALASPAPILRRFLK